MTNQGPPNLDVVYVGDSIDSSEFVDVLSGEEQDQWHVKTATCIEDGRAIVKTHHPDCIVCEYDISDSNGIVFLNTVREWYPEVPFILFTTNMETVAEEAISAGATDCIYNSGEEYNHRLLATRVQHAVETYQLQQTETQQDERFELFFTESPLGAVQWDDEFCFLRLNRRAEEILGYDEATLQGKSWEVIVAEDDQPHVGDAVSELLSADGGKHVTNKNIRADGEVRTLEWHNRAVTDSTGDVRSIFSKFRDITERRKREQELQELTERFELAVTSANIGIWDWDMTTDEVTYNEQWAQMLGYSIEEIEPHLDEWKQRVHSEDFAAAKEAFDNHIADETDYYETEHRMRTADGDWKWIRDTGRIVERDEAGEPVRAVGIHIDIDEQKTYEQTLKEQRNDLKILNQMVRHDIRNNLNIVVSYAKMLTDAVENEGAEYLQNVIDSGSEAIEITQTAGEVTQAMLRSEADLTPRNLQSVLQGEIAQVRENHERGIISAEEPLPYITVMADEMLESVFRNLLINAITHNDREVAEVTICTTIDEEVVRVRIADNGPGIPDMQKDQIFCEGEKGLDSGGTGMGLYLVQTLVDRYDGAVWVEDNEPEGSVFIVELCCD